MKKKRIVDKKNEVAAVIHRQSPRFSSFTFAAISKSVILLFCASSYYTRIAHNLFLHFNLIIYASLCNKTKHIYFVLKNYNNRLKNTPFTFQERERLHQY